MLDICIPAYVENVAELMSCIDSVEAYTSSDYRLIVCVDGGARDDITPVELLLLDLKQESDHCKDVQLLHNKQILFEAETAAICLGYATTDHVILLPGTNTIQDVKWIGSLMLPFLKDGLCMMTSNKPDVMGTAVPPFRMARRDTLNHTAILMLSKTYLKAFGYRFPDIRVFLAQKFMDTYIKGGGNCWGVPGIDCQCNKGKDPEMVTKSEHVKRLENAEVVGIL